MYRSTKNVSPPAWFANQVGTDGNKVNLDGTQSLDSRNQYDAISTQASVGLSPFVITNPLATAVAYESSGTIFGKVVEAEVFRDFRNALRQIKGTEALVKKLDAGDLQPEDLENELGEISLATVPWSRSTYTNWNRFVRVYESIGGYARKSPQRASESPEKLDLLQDSLSSIYKTNKVIPLAAYDFAGSVAKTKRPFVDDGPLPETIVPFTFSGNTMIFEDLRNFGNPEGYVVVREEYAGASTAPAVSLVVALRTANTRLSSAMSSEASLRAEELDALCQQYEAILHVLKANRLKRLDVHRFATSFERRIFLMANLSYAKTLTLKAAMSKGPKHSHWLNQALSHISDLDDEDNYGLQLQAIALHRAISRAQGQRTKLDTWQPDDWAKSEFSQHSKFWEERLK